MVASRDRHSSGYAHGHALDHERQGRRVDARNRALHARLVAVICRRGPLRDGDARTRVGDAHRDSNLLLILDGGDRHLRADAGSGNLHRYVARRHSS